MSVSAAALAVGKGAIALGKYLAALAPKVGSVVSSGILKATGSAAAAKALGGAAQIGTALALSEGVNRLTDLTVKKIPAVGSHVDKIVDFTTEAIVLGGMIK